MIPAYEVVQTKRAAKALLSRIYPGGAPAEEWRRVGLDTEFFVEDAPPNSAQDGATQLGYLQISNGKERIVIEGPLASTARGKKQDLIKLFRPWLRDSRVKKRISTIRADFKVLRSAGYGEMRGMDMDTEVLDWMYDENRMRHGLKDAAPDHVGIHMKSWKKLFEYAVMNKNGSVAKKKRVANLKEVLFGRDVYAQQIASLEHRREELDAEYTALKKLGKKASRDDKEAVRLELRRVSSELHELVQSTPPWTGKEGRKRMIAYAALDPYATFELGNFYRKKLKEQKLWRWYQQVEHPLTLTLIRMEDRGIRIDVDALDDIRHLVKAEALRNQHVVRAMVDKPDLNLASPKQMSHLIFEELGWPVVAVNKLTEAQEEAGQDEGNPSLSVGALDEYIKKGYKMAAHIKRFRNKSTLHNVFLVGALEKRDPATDLIHTIFKQTRTKTGRLSSGDRQTRKMNLQNIPSRKEKDPYRLRRFFQAITYGDDLIVADYSQIELYIVAQMSRDARMLQAFKRGEDLHMLTAAKIFGIKLPKDPSSWDPASHAYQMWKKACDEWKEEWADERGSAKIVNFGLNYGMSAYKLAIDFDMDESEAELWIEAYFELYPDVRRFMLRTIAFCRRHGYVLTMGGRRRRIPEIDSNDRGERGHAERQCMNAPIQGSAADIIKVSMNAFEYGLKYRCDEDLCPTVIKQKAQRAKDLGYTMLLQVHDELVGQAPPLKPKASDEVVTLVREVMEGVMPSSFPDLRIKASVGRGPNWNEAKH